MRWLGLLTLVIAGAAGLLWAAEPKEAAEPPVKGFFVHEWGVWRLHDDLEFANADMRAEWDGLPPFVYGQTTTRDFPRHWDKPLMTVTKPVLFFHAPNPMAAEVRVEFPTGVPAVWWPATHSPAYHGYNGDGLRKGETPTRPVKALQWTLHLKQAPRAPARPPVFKPLDKPHWMQALREVRCDDVYAPVGERGVGVEREKFVYYDGLLPRPKALAIKAEKTKATLKNEAKFVVYDVWVVDRRDADKPRVGRLPRLDAGDAADVDLPVMKDARWAEGAGEALTAQLKDAGLNEDEAAALTKIFTADFFRSAGVTLLYRLPQEEYDRLLPLTVKPRPEKVVRVGLIQQIPYEPELAERVARLVKQLDDDDFEKREAAQRELEKLGPVGLGYLQRLMPKVFAPEAKRRVDELLEKIESQRILKK
jgi:hypothetical protein